MVIKDNIRGVISGGGGGRMGHSPRNVECRKEKPFVLTDIPNKLMVNWKNFRMWDFKMSKVNKHLVSNDTNVDTIPRHP